ncbi:MAG: hypothetical protein HYY02_13660 [Chloroflexi bacterium]|nr:hypothetical protein [Chloroflexota bacterium]
MTDHRAGLALSVALGLAIVVGAQGCAPQPEQPAAQQPAAVEGKRGGVLMLLFPQSGDPPTFDMHQESSNTDAAAPVYDNLIMFDPARPGEIVPDLAESWELAPDGRSYLFRLRRGVRFQNGNPFTAADVKFTLERVINPPRGVNSPRKDAFPHVAGIETPDDYAVRILLKRPTPSLLPNLASGWMSMYDKEWIEAKGHEAPKKELMGTGPFKLKEYIRGTSLEYERNQDYWRKDRPYLDGIKMLIVPDQGTRGAAFRTGQVMMDGPNTLDFQKLKQEMGDQLNFQTIGGMGGIGFLHVNPSRKPFDDVRVREAINLVIDRDASIKVLAQGDADIGGFLPPSGAWTLSQEELRKLPGYAKDKTAEAEQAKRLMVEAGYAEGFKTNIFVRNRQPLIDASTFAVDQLRKLNITAEIKPQETARSYELSERGDFDMLVWGYGFALDDPDAIYSEHYLCNSFRNYARLCFPDIDALFERQSQEVDPAKRKALVLELERKAVPTAMKMVFGWSRARNVTWRYVKNYTLHPSSYNNTRFRDVWLDK